MSYLAVSSSSVLMPQLWYGSTQIGFDLQWDYTIVNDHRPSVLYLTSAKTKFFYDFCKKKNRQGDAFYKKT